MEITNLYIDKETGTPADTLLAFGLTHFIEHLIPDSVGDIALRLEDKGDCYTVTWNTPLQSTWIEEANFFTIIPGLNTKTKKTTVPQAIDYLQHQQRNNHYFESRKQGLTDEQLQENNIHPPHLDWPVWAIINQMSATATYNKLVEQWYSHQTCFPTLIEIILQIYQTRPNATAASNQAWKTLAKNQQLSGPHQITQLQVINPSMGKGGNRSKANGLGIGGLKAFWLPEYLKFVGLYQAALPRVVKGVKDRKTYILRPHKLTWRTHKNVFPAFQKVMYAQTAVQMDILANLTYCHTFLSQWLDGQGSRRFRRRGNPGNHVAAIETIFYKHLGSAHATLNLSSLALPLWLGQPIKSKEQAHTLLALIEEHRWVISKLEEKKGNQYNLLQAYRHFLSGHDINMFYQFMHGYHTHLMSQLARGQKPPSFTTSNLEVLIMAHDQDKQLSEIIHNQGFQHIAEAIRRSTVIPQRRKGKGHDNLYEIRYGLGNKLLRHAQYNDTFMRELSQFMHDYNRENARKAETRKQPQYRRDITTSDIEAIVHLIDKFNAPTVANLLVAYGYARDPQLGQQNRDETEA